MDVLANLFNLPNDADAPMTVHGFTFRLMSLLICSIYLIMQTAILWTLLLHLLILIANPLISIVILLSLIVNVLVLIVHLLTL